MDTYFDSVERSTKETILKEFNELKNNPIIDQLLESYPEAVTILNGNRQIVAFNS